MNLEQVLVWPLPGTAPPAQHLLHETVGPEQRRDAVTVAFGQEIVGVDAQVDDLVHVVDEPAGYHIAVDLGVELRRQVRPQTERLGADPRGGKQLCAGGNIEDVEVPLEPRPGLDRRQPAGFGTADRFDAEPTDLGTDAGAHSSTMRSAQHLRAEAHAEHRHPCCIGRSQQLELRIDPVRNGGVLDRPSRPVADDQVELGGVGKVGPADG